MPNRFNNWWTRAAGSDETTNAAAQCGTSTTVPDECRGTAETYTRIDRAHAMVQAEQEYIATRRELEERFRRAEQRIQRPDMQYPVMDLGMLEGQWFQDYQLQGEKELKEYPKTKEEYLIAIERNLNKPQGKKS